MALCARCNRSTNKLKADIRFHSFFSGLLPARALLSSCGTGEQTNDGHDDGLLSGHMLLLEYLLATIRMNRFAHLVGEHDLLGAVGIVLFHLFVRKRNNLEPVRIP